MPIRLDLYRLNRAARQLLSHDARSPEERRLDELPRLAPISSLTNIGRIPPLYECPSCDQRYARAPRVCLVCGFLRNAPRGVR